MITLRDKGIFLVDGVPSETAPISPEEGRKQTMAYGHFAEPQYQR